ncbi:MULTISPECIES: hypothetical protein [unclassified Acinetobacter]|uniref:hypothetical protein n=1 Tax=unclassified Acinetobacter TaxID=196816 RepID=UPI002449A219|nr:MULTISPECIES: hypothetical protein [unclassified Acinetobacter]MDH0032044.1 hypothetical protein [Acinetobacter sp. GD04021]MDH0887700.1 hypothetical protein [Acinetobacter sp. GD03873]MDH1084048.1 hypothetical protein [Acinetobacter sp. GD03983]MDH2191025.1 hypothetical protein [Acinetobacter sp. GD03645]MDH2204560.1 hypothetical protein [Acinetobacter sp. GD03647]
MIAITDKGELIPIKKGQAFTCVGFLGVIVTNPEDLANDEMGLIGSRFSYPDSEQLHSLILQVLHKYRTHRFWRGKLFKLFQKMPLVRKSTPLSDKSFSIQAINADALREMLLKIPLENLTQTGKASREKGITSSRNFTKE